MASFKQYTASGGASENFSIPTFSSDEIKVYVDGVLKTATTHYNITSYTTNGGTVEWTSGNIPSSGTVRIVRDTDVLTARATYAAGSSIKAGDLNDNQTQALRSLEEQDDQLIQTYDVENAAITTAKIKADNITNALIADTSVNTENLYDNAVTQAKLANNSVGGSQIINGAIDANELATDSVTTVKIVDSNVTTAKIQDDAVTSAKLDTNIDIAGTLDVTSTAQFDSNVNITGATGIDGNFDINTNKFTVAAATGNTVIAGNLDVTGQFDVTGTSNYTGQQTVPGGALVKDIRVGLDNSNEVSTSSGNLVLDSAGGTVQVTDTLDVVGNITVSGTVDGADVAAINTKLSGIEAGATADQSNAEIRAAVEAASDSNVFTDADHTKLNSIESSATADQTAAEIKTLLNSNKLETNQYADDSVTEDKLNADVFVTSGTSTSDTKTYSAKRAGELFYEKGTGDDIEASGVPWSGNDSTIATTAAIDKRIVDIVDDVGGFVPLTDEGEIPQYHPEKENTDTADRVGTILSIGTLTTTYTPSGGTCTINASDLSNHAVNATITDCGSTVLTSGYGVLVETKAQTDAQYAAGPSFKFHRLVPKATEVTTVAGSISNVNTVAGSISNVNTVAGNNSNVTTVAGVSGNVTTVAGISSNVTTVAGISSDVTAVAGDATDIGAVAAKATEIGRLGTADAVADMNTLGTNAIVSDLDTCATNVSNINTTAGSIANVNTVASNMGTVNDFAARYRTGSSNPTSSLDVGDLFFNTTANELKVYNGSAWQGGVTASGNFASTTGNTFTGDNLYNDSVKAKFGTGSDLQIYHSGTQSYIKHAGTGNLYIDVGVDDVFAITMAESETIADFKSNGAVELFYDSNKKLETTSYGAYATGTFAASGDINIANDTGKVQLGASNDLQIYHDSNNSVIQNSTGQLYIKSPGGINIDSASEQYIHCTENGNVQLYYDDSKKLETEANGVQIFDHLGVGAASNTGSCVYIKTPEGSDGSPATRRGLLVQESAWSDGNIIEAQGSTGNTIFKVGGTPNDIEIPNDTSKLKLGTSGDLQIYHDGTHSRIKNDTGGLYIHVDNGEFLNRAGDEVIAKFLQNSRCELYYDNSKKFETTSTGIDITGHVKLGDNNRVYFGDGDDMWIGWNGSDGEVSLASGALYMHDDIIFYDNKQAKFGSGADLLIYHNGSTSWITNNTDYLYLHADDTAAGIAYLGERHFIKNEANTEQIISAYANGAVELYYDNVKKLETTSTGIQLSDYLYLNDGKEIRLGDGGDLRVYHDGSNNIIRTYHGGQDLYIATEEGEVYIQTDYGASNSIACIDNGAVNLYYDNSKKFETASYGAITTGTHQVTGNFEMVDNGQALFGTGGDLKIYHDGTWNWIDAVNNHGTILRAGTNDLFLQGGNVYLSKEDATEYYLKAISDGAVELYYDNTKKFETTSTGITVTGKINPTGNIHMPDSVGIKLGASDDLVFWHYSGDNKNYITSANDRTLRIHADNGDETMAQFIPNGAVELYSNNTKVFETTTNGVQVLGTEGNDANLYIFPDEADDLADQWRIRGSYASQNLRIESRNSSGNYEPSISCYGDGTVELCYDNDKKFETTSTGINVTGGIRLGGNNSANEMDDYEEGSWTPTFSFSGSFSSGSLTSQGGTYTKVGRLVTAHGMITLSAKGPSSGVPRISGLPFAMGANVANTGQEGAGWLTWFSSLDAGGFTVGGVFWMEEGQTYADLYGFVSGNDSLSQMSQDNFRNNSDLRFTFMYMT